MLQFQPVGISFRFPGENSINGVRFPGELLIKLKQTLEDQVSINKIYK